MSFAHFRLEGVPPQTAVPHVTQNSGGITQQAPLTAIPLTLANVGPSSAPHANTSQFQVDLVVNETGPETKPPYTDDDGYTLVFASMDEFLLWRESEEMEKCVEFVKGDTHGSKAQPPRFKNHTKLVCARHSRSGRKKYVKKHPERQRKVPSRKLEGTGCPAAISYKTYFDSDTVRASYQSQHSHEIGPANLPFTRRGRKQLLEQEKHHGKRKGKVVTATSPAPTPPVHSHQSSSLSGALTSSTATLQARPSDPRTVDGSSAEPMHSHLPPAVHSDPGIDISFIRAQPPQPPQHSSIPTYANSGFTSESASTSLMSSSQHPAPRHRPTGANGQWDRLSILFNQIHSNSRSFTYPPASVAVLESVLIRLYLESPISTQSTAQANGTHSVLHHPVETRQNITLPEHHLGTLVSQQSNMEEEEEEDDEMEDAEGELEYEEEEGLALT